MFLLRYQTLPFFFSSQFVLVNSLEVCEEISLKNERRKPRREKRRKKTLTESTPCTLVFNSAWPSVFENTFTSYGHTIRVVGLMY